ncbi:ABC transporter permease [Clostridium paraputrificum]|uniref:ABC transporter permease n=1 Tax=Clostridium paraputrificum TaxID=29363 RepID=UPI003D3350C5
MEILNSFFTVIKKELTDIIRDRKTLAFTILLPILIYPVMFKIMSISMKSSVDDAKKEIRVVIEGDKESSIAGLLKGQEAIKIDELDDPKEALKSGDIQLIVNIPEGFDTALLNGEVKNIEILIDDESNKSTAASSIVKEIYDLYSKQIVEGRLAKEGINKDILTPFNLDIKSGVSKDGEINSIGTYVLGMLPSMVVLLLLSPTMGLAAEMGAGEKEKNTFEPLLSTSGNRNSLLWGKITSLCIVGTITLIASMISLWIAFKGYVADLSGGQELTISLTGKAIVLIMIICMFLIVAICAIQMCISIFARSTKEANTYLSGILMPTMLLSFVPMFLDVKNMNALFFHLPIANSVCLMKEFMVGIFDTQHILIVLAWQIGYVGLSVLAAKVMFSREEVVFRS